MNPNACSFAFIQITLNPLLHTGNLISSGVGVAAAKTVSMVWRRSRRWRLHDYHISLSFQHFLVTSSNAAEDMNRQGQMSILNTTGIEFASNGRLLVYDCSDRWSNNSFFFFVQSTFASIKHILSNAYITNPSSMSSGRWGKLGYVLGNRRWKELPYYDIHRSNNNGILLVADAVVLWLWFSDCWKAASWFHGLSSPFLTSPLFIQLFSIRYKCCMRWESEFHVNLFPWPEKRDYRKRHNCLE